VHYAYGKYVVFHRQIQFCFQFQFLFMGIFRGFIILMNFDIYKVVEDQKTFNQVISQKLWQNSLVIIALHGPEQSR